MEAAYMKLLKLLLIFSIPLIVTYYFVEMGLINISLEEEFKKLNKRV